MTREEILAEMTRVAEGLEKPGLSDVQRARGMARYETLEEELNDLNAAEERERKRQQKAEEAQQENGDIAARALEYIFQTLDPRGERYKKRKVKA